MQSDIALPDLSAYKDQIDGHMGRWLKDIISHMNDSDYFAKFTVVGSNDKAIYSTGSNGTKKGISWGSQFYDLIREVLNLRRKVFKQHEWSAKYVSPVILLLEFRHLLQMHSRLLDSANAPAHIAQGFLPISGALANGKIEEFKSVVMYGQGDLPDSALSFTQFLGDLFFKGVDTKNSLSCKSPVVLFDWERGKAENDLLFEFEEINDHVVRFKIVSSIPYGQEIPLDDGRTLRSIQLDYKKVGVIGEQLRLKLIKSLETFFGKKRFDYLSDKYLQRFTWSVVYFVLEEEMAQRIGGINNRELEAIRFSYYPSSYRATSITGVLVTDILLPKEDASFLSSIESGVQVSQLLTRPIYELALTRMGVHAAAIERNELRQASTKAAIGSIMSRNGSHNIGSHVLSALSHNVGTMPDDRVLYQYIQHRMDYIASATTGAPDWSVPTPFVGNLMKMFYSQRHLLDHIAESDGLHAYQYQGKGTQIGDGQNDCVKIIVRRISHREGEIVGEKEEVKEKNVFGKTVYMYEFFQETPSTSEDSDNANKTEKNGDASLKENVDETVKPVKWENDEAVSVPGGVLGQHAFYNVVENILRNAAKHSWAGKSKAEREQAKNLEIYVDFEKDQPDGTMWFTVGDNMSKLFPGDFWQKFFDEVKKPQKNQEVLAEQSWVKEFAEPLDGFAVPKEEDVKKLPKGVSRREYIEHFLADDEKYPDSGLPPHYKALYDYVAKKWTFLKDNPDFLILLRGKDPNDPKNPNEKLGHRLPLPLHHRQEIALSEPFIDLETNRLRQSAWGLSEMKISAGYLRRAKVSVIGGLEQPKFGEHPLIVPLGVPRSGKKDVQWDDMCLAYRFWVKLPKDVLIVADNPIQWERFTQWEGIGVESYDRVFGCVDRQGKKKDHVGLMSDYGFVLVDHTNRKGKREDDDKLKLPFRALEIMDGAQTGAWGLPCALASTLKEARTRKDFVEYVYSVWLGWLQKRRAPEATESDLTIKLNIYDEKGGEKGLISDRDIYKVLFRECLHSVLEPIVVNYQIENFDAWQRKALLLVSMYPLNEDDDLFGSVKEKEGDHVFRIEGLLVKIAQKVRQFWMSLPCSQEMNCGKTQQVLGAYRESLNRAKYSSIRPFALELLAELDSVQDNAGNGVDPLLCQALDDLSKKPPKITILGEAVKALDIARTTSDVFLRKYEERISTLPSQYKGTKQPKKPKLNFGAFGVNIFCRDTGEDIDISYNRHSTDGARLYSEPLSGSQTYLNALSNLSDDDSQWAMRLAENGLLRIAIIDERVRAFIAEHGDDIKKTYVAMHIAVVDTEIKPDFDSEKAILPDLTKLQFLVRNARDADFDLVVIHQGIIDKWWPNKHRQTDVADILSSLRQSGGSVHSRFVVVTTGRGRPDNIPETAKVLAFSSIEAFLFKRYPEKLNLVNSLMSILPGSPERNDDHD